MISKKDSAILSDLAKRVREISEMDIMAKRREKWRLHNDLQTCEPLILVSPEGSWGELLPGDIFRSEGDIARGIEWDLRSRIYRHQHIDDDSVISGDFIVPKKISGLGGWGGIDINIPWGLTDNRKHSANAERGAYKIEGAINDFNDIQKLSVPKIFHDKNASLANLAAMQEVLGDILDVKLTGITQISFHIMYFYIHFRGLEQMYIDLYDEPEFALELIRFFENGYEDILNQCLAQNLFDLNNGDIFVGSGGFGNTGQLPKENYDPGNIRLCDLWASAEAQEMSSVSPQMTEKFVIQSERRLLEKFGLTAYGCCEALEDKLEYVLKLPNIRRLSISPFANLRKCAEILQDKYILSWKPNPVYVSGPGFCHKAVTEYLKEARAYTQDCVTEVILADTHTCHHEGWRFKEWVRICREVFQG